MVTDASVCSVLPFTRPNVDMDLQPFRAEVTAVGCSIVHRPVPDRLKGLAMAVSNTNGGMRYA